MAANDLIGINLSVWLWSGSVIRKVFDGETRNEWAFARGENGQVFVAVSFSRGVDPKLLARIREVAQTEVVVVPASASFLAVRGGRIIAVSNSGSITAFDQRTLEKLGKAQLPLLNATFVRSVNAGPRNLAIGTDAGCFLVDPQALFISTIARGACPAAFEQSDGTLWVSQDGTFRRDGSGWRRWFGRGSDLGMAGTFADDGKGNVWVGANGLWRHTDIIRDAVLSDQNPDAKVSGMIADGEGGVIVGLSDGTAWRILSDLRPEALPLPGNASGRRSLSRGAIPARDRNGEIWVLNHHGLYRMAGGAALLVALPPAPGDASRLEVSALAVWDKYNVYAGFFWSNEIVRLQDGQWRRFAELEDDSGGSATAGLAFDDEGALWAVGPRSVLRAKGRETQSFGPFDRNPFGKRHLFGSLGAAPTKKGMAASGGWGGIAFLLPDGSSFRPLLREGGADQPYLIRSLAIHPLLGLLAASDTGLHRWEGSEETGAWHSLRAADPRLDRPADAVVPGLGRSFWLASGRSIRHVVMPADRPEIDLRRTPTATPVGQRSVTLDIGTRSLAGSPRSKTIAVRVDPALPGFPATYPGPVVSLVLSELSDGTSYRVTAQASDEFGNSGNPRETTFPIVLPFYQNPVKLAGAIVLGVIMIALLVTRRGPTGFLLRRLAGKRWRLQRAEPRLRLHITSEPTETRFQMQAPSQQSTIELSTTLPTERIAPIQQSGLAGLATLSNRYSGEGLIREFDRGLVELGHRIASNALPDAVRLAFSPAAPGSVQFILDDGLLNIPWEIAAQDADATLGLTYAVGRVVRSQQLAAKDDEKHPRRLRFTIFSPRMGAGQAQLHFSAWEAKAVARRAAAWGAEVRILPAESTKETVLDALASSQFFHYAGHAEFNGKDPAKSYLPLAKDSINAGEIHDMLSTRPNSLLLAFVNGCGSSREGDWQRGQAVFGLASAFLSNATYFVGAQWPVQDGFAAKFADEFYRHLFPDSSALWWRWLRREPLSGLPFAEALRMARIRLKAAGPRTVPTWQAYVYYGDATCRLTME